MSVRIPTLAEFSSDQEATDEFFYWRMCDELTVVQAALLMIGIRPDKNGLSEYVMGHEPDRRPENFDAALRVISAGLQTDKVKGRIVEETERTLVGMDYEYADIPVSGSLNVQLSTVDSQSLREYLNQKGLHHGFFRPLMLGLATYLDPMNKCYAPKLAAAVEAWSAVTEAKDYEQGGTPKQAIEKWLRLNAARLGLTLDSGNPNNQGIEEIAKIVNWQPGGGASKTPRKAKPAEGKANPTTPLIAVK